MQLSAKSDQGRQCKIYMLALALVGSLPFLHPIYDNFDLKFLEIFDFLLLERLYLAKQIFQIIKTIQTSP